MRTKFYSNAQGTIEYLVILAVVVVISLVVVGLASGVIGGSSISVSSSASKLASHTGAIVISEAVVNPDGNYLVRLQNNTGETITIESVTVGSVSFSVSNSPSVPQGSAQNVVIDTSDVCSLGESRPETVTVHYTSASGLPKTFVVPTDVLFGCTNYSVVNALNGVVDEGAPSCEYTYDDWSPSTCPESEEQTRNLLSTTPEGCSGTPELTQSCDYEPPIEFEGCWDADVDPHPICSCLDLNAVRNNLDWSYELQQDVNCEDTINWNNGAGFHPIGNISAPFVGSIDGKGFAVKGLYVNNPGVGSGLFGAIASHAILNRVGLVDVNIHGNGNFVGGLVGHVGDYGLIKNSYSINGKIFGNEQGTGGLVGGFETGYGQISNSYAIGEVSSWSYAGGLVGLSSGSKIINSYSGGTIPSNVWASGGLVGYDDYGSITNSYSTSTVYGTTYVAGFAGVSDGLVTNSFSTGWVQTGKGFIDYEALIPPLNYGMYWFDDPTDGVTECGASFTMPSDPNCIKITELNGGVSYFYSHLNEPLATWGTWENVSGDLWSTTDGNWSICEGIGLPWLTWEDRSC